MSLMRIEHETSFLSPLAGTLLTLLAPHAQQQAGHEQHHHQGNHNERDANAQNAVKARLGGKVEQR